VRAIRALVPVLVVGLVLREPPTLFIREYGIDVMVSMRLQDGQLAFRLA
jgi:hypothetical protein